MEKAYKYFGSPINSMLEVDVEGNIMDKKEISKKEIKSWSKAKQVEELNKLGLKSPSYEKERVDVLFVALN